MTEEIIYNQKLINVENDYEHIKQLINLKAEQYKQSLDYITNLQQENEKLRLDVKYWENKWQNTRFANNQVKVLQDTIIKSANNTNKAMEQTEIYKSRCKKAINHIEESLDILKGDSDIPIATGNVRNRYLKPVLNILKGSDEE